MLSNIVKALNVFKTNPYLSKNIEKLQSANKNVALNNVIKAIGINKNMFQCGINNTSLLNNNITLQQELFNHIVLMHKHINSRNSYINYEKLKPKTFEFLKKIVYNDKSSYIKYEGKGLTIIEEKHIANLVEDLHYLIVHRHYNKTFTELEECTPFTNSISRLISALSCNKQKISYFNNTINHNIVNINDNIKKDKNFINNLKSKVNEYAERYYNKTTKIAEFIYDTSIDGYSCFKYFKDNYGLTSTRNLMKEQYKNTEKLDKQWRNFLYFIENNQDIEKIRLSISDYFYSPKIKELCMTIAKNPCKIESLSIKFCAKDKPTLSYYDFENFSRLLNVEKLVLQGFDNVNLNISNKAINFRF